MRIDLNADVGESFGAYTIGHDAGLMKSITSANVAAGFHAGDPTVLRETIRLAKANGVAVGAHPGFPDLVDYALESGASSVLTVHGHARDLADELRRRGVDSHPIGEPHRQLELFP